MNFKLILLLAVISLSFVADLEYKDVAESRLKILIPKNLAKFSTRSIKYPMASSQAKLEDFYATKDTAESIKFIKLPKTGDEDFYVWKQMFGIGLLKQATKTYYNDVRIVNGKKIYVVKFDLPDRKKSMYNETYMVNARDCTVWVWITCDQKHKDAWLPVSDKVLNSIKVY